ncbi:glycoside hydrolase family 88 protein [Globicatella sp. PHS-GS-PNBC-21-1553]|nr:glycoside hydrolase family 88 protein [Globicatella sp. PHS-GS-PNBC-21-1553]
MAFVLEKIRKNQSKFFDKIPWAASKDLKYPVEENDYWTASFWIGQLFLVKEYFNSNEFDMVIKKQLETFDNRLKNKVELETHDIGFLYILSAIADYKINGTESSKKMAIDAADALMIRFNEKAGIIQAWGKLDDLDEGGRMIIDCLMNLPLLYFATEMTGDDRYRKAANRHAKQTQKYIVRENATTFHTYFFDRRTGEGIKGETAQGFSDDSCWARGQAWGIYGFTLSYLYTGDYSYLETAQLLADYFISQLPSDNVCYWDLVFNDGSHEERDSSAAAIAASGLLELAKQLPLSNNRRQQYEEKAVQIAKSLSQNYITKDNEEADGLLLHAVYDKNSNKGVDESVIWGDYFYVETLVRLGREWNKYW